jgi:methylated-DNA-[protein]-cysteine S-methyltransferase
MNGGVGLFETRLGLCGIAWSVRGIRGVQLPAPSESQALSDLRRRFPDLEQARPLPFAETAIIAVTNFLEGEIETNLAGIELDLDRVSDWERRVYVAAREIPVGTTVTYGILAKRLGDLGLARAVGQALGRNPWPIIIPCHRITASAGAMGGFSAPGGRATKMKLLEMEGALAPETLPLFAKPED